MEIYVEWQKEIQLNLDVHNSYKPNLNKIPTNPGMYIFAKRHGRVYKVLYVGQAVDLQNRIRSHLNNHRLQNHLAKAGNGNRILILGIPRIQPGQNINKVLNILERGFIRKFIADNVHDLINRTHVKINRHAVYSQSRYSRALIPSSIYLEKMKKE